MAGRQEIEEKKKRKTLKMEDDTKAIEVQDAKLQELKALIEEEQNKFDAQNEQLVEELKKNRVEEAKSRDLN